MNKIPLTINELKSDSEFNYEIYTKEALISTIVSIRDYICNLEKELGSNNKRLSRVAENRYDKILELEQENQQLKEKLQQKEDVINKAKVDLEKHLNAKSYDNHKYELFDRKYLEEVLEILNNKGSDNNE